MTELETLEEELLRVQLKIDYCKFRLRMVNARKIAEELGFTEELNGLTLINISSAVLYGKSDGDIRAAVRRGRYDY